MIAAVGFAGLAAAQGISVIERRREFGVLRAIGARRAQLLTTLLVEGALFWLAALVLALGLSLPLSAFIGRLIGTMTFALPLPFAVDWPAFALWAAISLAGALAASLPPDMAAARASVTTSLK
ncbi:MAG: FtsX-like permease family protein, partial [Rhodobacteraceae bacterium]|nr:FtsX-like permease family protein [Paracoccaceae bacterium]